MVNHKNHKPYVKRTDLAPRTRYATKKCPSCKRRLPVATGFYATLETRDRLSVVCIDCFEGDLPLKLLDQPLDMQGNKG